jgi:hypothetical protein
MNDPNVGKTIRAIVKAITAFAKTVGKILLGLAFLPFIAIGLVIDGLVKGWEYLVQKINDFGDIAGKKWNSFIDAITGLIQQLKVEYDKKKQEYKQTKDEIEKLAKETGE